MNSNTRDQVDQEAPLVGQATFNASGFGPLWVVWSEVGLTRLLLPDRGVPFPAGDGPDTVQLPARFREPLEAYFAGETVDPAELPVDLRGTDFQCRVWRALRATPRGKVRTYGGIAKDVGAPRGMRAVGMANSANPLAIVVPCHRIVEAGNRIGGYTGGVDKKRFLLEIEGVQVVGDKVLPGQLDLW